MNVGRDHEAELRRSAELEHYAAGRLGAVLLDAKLVVLGMSQGALTLSGHSAQTGRSALELVHPDDMERAGEALVEATAVEGASAEGMYRLRFADATYHEFGVTAICLGPERDNETIFQFGVVPEQLRAGEFARDTVDAMRMLAESHELDAFLERVHRLAERHILGASLKISTRSEDGTFHTHSRTADGAFAVSTVGSASLPEQVERALEHDRQGPWRSFHRMALYEPEVSARSVTSVLTNDNNELFGYVETELPTAAEPDEHQWMVHGLIRQVLTLVLQRLELDKQLRRAADVDPLTGLANRRRLFADMNDAADLEGTSVLLVDLDRFSWINNTLGHHVGDQALVDLADSLRDVCPPTSTIARFGGDEFVIWVPDSAADPQRLAGAIRTRQSEHRVGPDQRAVVRCSIGAVQVGAGESPHDAIKRADEAMYIAKRRGGDSTHSA